MSVAIIGGSGLYELGPPVTECGPIAWCEVEARRIAFLNRHGPGHRLPPHAVDYLGNLRALHEAGVRSVFATFA